MNISKPLFHNGGVFYLTKPFNIIRINQYKDNSMIDNKILLETYMIGFSDELEGETREFKDPILMRAYELGKVDAFVGDDVRSVDYQSDEHLLKRIKNYD